MKNSPAIPAVLRGLIRYTISILFGICIIFLTCLAAFTTADIDFSEKTYVLADSFGMNLLVLLLAVLLGCILWRHWSGLHCMIERINTDPTYSKKVRRIALVVFGIAAAMLVLVLQKAPVADQQTVCSLAQAWRNHDYSSLKPGGYLEMYPNQLGITIFLYILSLIFGTQNVLVVQLLNVVALLVLYRTFADLSDMAGQSRFTGFSILVFCELFLPAVLYVTFVYGTLMGLACSVAATKAILCFDRDGKIRQLAAAVALSFAAIFLKSNYQIFAIGNVILLIVLMLRKCNLRKAVLLVLMLLVLMLSNSVISGLTYGITGQKPGSGMSSWSWAAMGLRENELRYDGWYDASGYEAYLANPENAEALGQEAKQEVLDRLAYFKKHPGEALSFFTRKNTSQWNNPTFQGLWINQRMGSIVSEPPLIRWLFSTTGGDLIEAVLNYVCFLILAGVLAFLFLKKQKSDLFTVFAVIFLGGFLFHTIWEAKAQYTLPYFLLLLPISIVGYKTLIKALSGLKLPYRNEKLRIQAFLPMFKDRSIIFCLAVIVIGCGIRLFGLNAGQVMLKSSADAAAYKNYTAQRIDVKERIWGYELNTSITPGWIYWYGNDYYLQEDGTLATGWLHWNDSWYYLKKDGSKTIGWVSLNGDRYYFREDGTMATDWINLNGNWYDLQSSGIEATGWVWYNDAWYYLQTDGAMATGWFSQKGNRYYLQDDGAMATGWIKTDDYWYYLQDDGIMATGWIKVDNAWYYLQADGTMATGWIDLDGRRYYLQDDGTMAKGWTEVEEAWYYLQNDGTMATGWMNWDESRYYLQDDGIMATGTKVIHGKHYSFAQDGALLSS